VAIDGQRYFLLGANYPWINYGHDFGATAWGHNGVSAPLAAWWRPQDYTDSLGVRKVAGSAERAVSGSHSLRMTVNLVGGDPQLSKGEAYVDLRYHAPPGVASPANLDGIRLSCRVFAPPGSGGEASRPNGIQVFAKDDAWRGEYGTWVNIVPGAWNEVALTPSTIAPDHGSIEPGFDARRIVMLGVKIAIGTNSSARFQGDFWLDVFTADERMWFDFEDASQADKDFAEMAAKGVRVARWFVFGDGRAAPKFEADGGVATGGSTYDRYFMDDVDEALAAAQRHHVKLVLVLLDFHWCDNPKTDNGVHLGGHADVIVDLAKRVAFVENAVAPLVRHCRAAPAVLAWDVINEPEWAITITSGASLGQPVPLDAMRDLVRRVSDVVHREAPCQLVTLSSASRKWLRLWQGLGLDFYQYHYYDWMEGDSPFDVICRDLGLDKPCILGEFPTQGSAIPPATYLDKSLSNGYGGALAWSYRAGDQWSDFPTVHLNEWVRVHPTCPVVLP